MRAVDGAQAAAVACRPDLDACEREPDGLHPAWRLVGRAESRPARSHRLEIGEEPAVPRRAAGGDDAPTATPVVPAIVAGAGIGLLSGLTGRGGGIFLTPLILFAGWSEVRVAAGISAAFVLANSISGLLGNLASIQSLPAALPVWLLAATAGGLLGAELGARRLAAPALRLALAMVLVIAGLKLIFLG